jgi:hypothetical protein
MTVAEACSGPNVYRYEAPASTTSTSSTAPQAPGSTAPPTSVPPGPTVPATAGPARSVTSTTAKAQVAASADATTTSSVMLEQASPPTTQVLAGGKTVSKAQKIHPTKSGGPSIPAFLAFAGLLSVIVGRTVQLRRRRSVG